MRSACLYLVLLLSTAPLLEGQDTPPLRAHHALVYDAAAERVLLTGGSTPINGGQSFTFYDDVWAFDGRTWTRLPNSSFVQSGQRLAFDSRRNRIWSYGGFANNQSLPHLLIFDSDTWRKVGELPDRPSAEGGAVYDSQRDRVVVFGGSRDRNTVHGDTWEYDGERWTHAATEGPARQAFAAAYDGRRGRTVLFGGFGTDPRSADGDTWEYDGTRWTRVAAAGPSPRIAPGGAYDSKRGLFILFGGSSGGGTLSDTWAWDGHSWRKLADVGPPARMSPALAYDAARDRIVLFGGRASWPNDLADTWEWDGIRWTQVR